MAGCLGAKRTPGSLGGKSGRRVACVERGARAPHAVSCARGVREVVEIWGDVLVGVERASVRMQAFMRRSAP